MATRIGTGASCAPAAASLRGSARKVMPNAFTKAATARPAARARPAMARAKARFIEGCGSRMFCSSAWKVSHSLTKPLSGGSPALATAPARKQAAVHGWRLISPPSASMSRVPVPCRTPPAAMNSRLLKAA